MKRLFVLLAATLAISRLENGWQYAHARGGPWQEQLDRDPRAELWMRVALPELPTGAHLVFRAYVGAIEVYADDARVYAFDDAKAREHITVHDVALPHARTLLIHVPQPGEGPIFGGAPLVVSQGALPYARVQAVVEPLREDLDAIGIGIVLLVIGAIAIAVSRLRRRGDPSALLWFGIFAGLYGLRLLTDSAIPIIVGESPLLWAYATALITYVIPIPGWLLASRLIHARSLRWQVMAFTLFAPIGIASDLIQRRPASLDAVNNVLVVLGGINILANLLLQKKWRDPELRVVLGGATLFMLFALVNNLANLGVLRGLDLDETYGFLIFVAVLGYASMRSFMRAERQRVALEGELATAREIQRSILPAEMPRVRGLRVEARYVPASSVAGDLYDFLAVDDDHLGVIVADVSGHGVPAALIASMVKIAVSSHAPAAHDPAAMLANLAGTLRRDVRRTFVTATYLWFDAEQRCVSVANAGHPAPLLLRNGTFSELGAHGVVLGRFGNTAYTATTTRLEHGDRIVAFTDGIIEARNARGEPFGEERLMSLIRDSSEVAGDIVNAVLAWRTDEDADDLTLVVIDYSMT